MIWHWCNVPRLRVDLDMIQITVNSGIESWQTLNFLVISLYNWEEGGEIGFLG